MPEIYRKKKETISKYEGEPLQKKYAKLAGKITDNVKNKLRGVKSTDPEYWGLREILTETDFSSDQLIREITMKVLAEHHVILTAIGVYSVNTKDEEVIRTQERVRQIAFSHEHVRQMHGFYLQKEKKTMRFDIVVSFDAKDRRAVYADVVSDVAKAFPDYQLQVAMDTDFAEE